MRRILILLMVVALSHLGAYAAFADLDEAFASYSSHDYAKAFAEFKKAADQGNAAAQHSLGYMYQYGKGVPQNYNEAVKWYHKAAYNGYADAQFNLGYLYQHGKGLPLNLTEAAKWFRLAANQNNVAGQAALGMMYFEGSGLPQDYILAHMWLNLAASKGSAEYAKLRDDCEDKMTPQEIAKAQGMARKWKPKKQ